MKGCIVRSIAGHDKGSIYIVIGESEESLIVADGYSRTIESPKKKNSKHIEILQKEVNKEIVNKLESHTRDANESVKQYVASYKRQHRQED